MNYTIYDYAKGETKTLLTTEELDRVVADLKMIAEKNGVSVSQLMMGLSNRMMVDESSITMEVSPIARGMCYLTEDQKELLKELYGDPTKLDNYIGITVDYRIVDIGKTLKNVPLEVDSTVRLHKLGTTLDWNGEFNNLCERVDRRLKLIVKLNEEEREGK